MDADNTRYLISRGDDEENVQTFADIWEPEENANQEAIKDWREHQAEEKKATHGQSINDVPLLKEKGSAGKHILP